jgi:branched-chain amino acid transport system ATP-binding protein
MLTIQDVHTYYGDSHVLQGVTMHVDRATVAAVLGRNGVGKTTLCRSIVGFTPARSGRIVFRDVETTSLPPHRISAMRIGLVPQGRRIFSSLTVDENLAIAARQPAAGSGQLTDGARPGPSLSADLSDEARCAKSEARSAKVNGPGNSWTLEKAFSVFPRLRERRKNRGNQLSGGEQQMLAIARALVANPLLLVMDEPTEGLSPQMVAEVASLIRRLKSEGTAVLLAEQNAAFAVTVADHVHVMSKGAIVHSSDPAALWANEEIKAQYLGVPTAPSLP